MYRAYISQCERLLVFFSFVRLRNINFPNITALQFGSVYTKTHATRLHTHTHIAYALESDLLQVRTLWSLCLINAV